MDLIDLGLGKSDDLYTMNICPELENTKQIYLKESKFVRDMAMFDTVIVYES